MEANGTEGTEIWKYHCKYWFKEINILINNTIDSFIPYKQIGGVRAFSGTTAAASTGKVTQVIGAVVDVQVSTTMMITIMNSNEPKET